MVVQLWEQDIKDFGGDAAVEAIVRPFPFYWFKVFGLHFIGLNDFHCYSSRFMVVTRSRICFQFASSQYIEPRKPNPFKLSGCSAWCKSIVSSSAPKTFIPWARQRKAMS